MTLANKLPLRAMVHWLLASIAAVLLLTSSARAEMNWLMGGNWVQLEKPCSVRHADGREENVGMEFMEGMAILHLPPGFDLNIPASKVPARYQERGDTIWVRLQFANGETSNLILQRADGDRMRDSVGYLYRRCIVSIRRAPQEGAVEKRA
ncbi:hypothetical protein, partial [Skermanella aerolata]|uniref:hypothetical protein n=2 Tax=Skermanella aerolata TaxID=393310 RepID=UPI0005C87AAD